MSGTETFPNQHLIWTPAQLHPRLGEENLVILDVRPAHEVMEGIIPGAAHLDLYGLGLTHTRPGYFEEWIHMMRSQFALRGAGRERTVVIYEETTGNRAGRAFWLMEYMGHGDVHVLDGGMKAWRAAGYETVKEMKPHRPVSFRLEPRPELFIGAAGLLERLDDPGVVILDTRSDQEWNGENKRGGPRGGTLPGAVHLEWDHTLDQEGKFKPPGELAALFEAVGVTRDKAIVPF